MIFENIIPYHVHTSHKKHSSKVWSKTEHFENLSFSDTGLRVSAVTFGPRDDPNEKISLIIEILKFNYYPIELMN